MTNLGSKLRPGKRGPLTPALSGLREDFFIVRLFLLLVNQFARLLDEGILKLSAAGEIAGCGVQQART
ncbi:MAG TPA: hypothetical protein PLJ24_07985 [Anaerolineae bacterium]|nr:hypothetical protein [Anaerolineae bacterium]